MSLQVGRRTLKSFVDLVTSREPFTFSRWGDGEWASVLGRVHGRNVDGHRFLPELGFELAHVLKSRPSYILGMQDHALHAYGKRILSWIAEHHLDDLDWVGADVFARASAGGKLGPLIGAVRRSRLLLVGPPRMATLKSFLHYDAFVPVPPRDCYLAVKEALNDTLAAVDHLGKPPVLIAISAGMPAKLLIHRLHKALMRKHQIVDFGSLWDPWTGVRSRRYMRGLDLRSNVPLDGLSRGQDGVNPEADA